MKPGQLVVYDYRDATPASISTTESHPSLKVLQWNVERNYASEDILTIMNQLDPDVAILQEVDIDCKRSGSRNHMEEMCKALKMKGGFVCEFHEIDSPVRELRNEGGGFHGNAILSKYDIDFQVLEHQYQPFDWPKDGLGLGEPREGRRYTLIGVVKAGSLPPIRCYCVHLEVFTGIIGRVASFSEILKDAAHHVADTPHQIIFGDLNTMAHSIVRLSPKYARDRYRWLSLGESESSWWHQNVFGFHWDDGEVNHLLARAGFTRHYPLWLFHLLWSILGAWPFTLISGFNLPVLRTARNPGFYDPWPYDDVTLENPSYGGLFKAKLDWTLVRYFKVVQKWTGNADYRASDHRYLMVRITPDEVTQTEDSNYHVTWAARRRQYEEESALAMISRRKSAIVTALIIAVILGFYRYFII